jgi:hypothetical protein
MMARARLITITPTQSMSNMKRFHDIIGVLRVIFGSCQISRSRITKFIIAMILKPHCHPIVSTQAPPSTRPTANPIGRPPPMVPKAMFLLRPGENVFVMILTAEGRQKEEAIPPRPRSTIICVPVLDRPLPRVKAVCSKFPSKYIG